MDDEKRVNVLRRFFIAEKDPGPLTSLALGDAAGRSLAIPELRLKWVESLGDLKCRRALELGCGHGGEMAPLAKDGAKVVGIDFSPRRLKAARSIAPGASTMIADAERLPFKDGVFSLVYGNSILLHLDRAKAFAEIKRVLEPDGTAVFFEPLDRHPLLCVYRPLFTRRRDVARYTSLEELERLSLGGETTVIPWYLTAALPVFIERVFGSSRLTRGLTLLLSRFDSLIFHRCPHSAKRAWVALAVYHKG